MFDTGKYLKTCVITGTVFFDSEGYIGKLQQQNQQLQAKLDKAVEALKLIKDEYEPMEDGKAFWISAKTLKEIRESDENTFHP